MICSSDDGTRSRRTTAHAEMSSRCNASVSCVDPCGRLTWARPWGRSAGCIPPELGGMIQATFFDVRNNQLSGEYVTEAVRMPGRAGSMYRSDEGRQ